MSPESSSPTLVAEQDRHLAPTLIIGLGGSGKDAVLRVRRLFYERHGHTGFPIVGYLVLDTDKNAFTRLEGDSPSDYVLRSIQLDDRGAIPEALDCSLTPREFSDYFRGGQAQYPHIFRWLDPAMERFGANAIVAGAGQQRPFGRLAFFHHFDRIVNTLNARIREILRQADEANRWRTENMVIDPQRLEVILVYSIAGGTGAGMFLDMGMLVRQLIQKGLGPTSSFPEPLNIQPSFTHIAVLPEGFVQAAQEGKIQIKPQEIITIQENAFAGLRELEFFSQRPEQAFDLSIPPPSPRLGEEPGACRKPWYQAWWSRNSDPIEIDLSPWDCCYLVGGSNDLMSVGYLMPHEIYQMIAEYIFLDFDPNRFGIKKRSLRPNSIGPNLIPMKDPVYDDKGNFLYNHYVSRRFSLLGLSQIYFDRDRMRRAASHRLAWLLINQWWLRQLEMPPKAQADMVQQDWAGHAAPNAAGRTMPLTYEGLRDFILRVNINDQTLKTRWDEVRDEVAALKREVESGKYDRSEDDPITRLERRHEQMLLAEADGTSNNGLALKTFEHHRKAAEPEIETRLRNLFRLKVQQLGVRGALKVFESYGNLYAEQEKMARSVQSQTPAKSRDREDRLVDARKLPLPFCASQAVRIELLRGLKQSGKYLIGLYHHGVVPDVRHCLKRIGHRLSTAETDVGASYYQLLGRFQTILESKTGQLTGVSLFLARRFEELRQAEEGQTRTVGLLPEMDATKYDSLIVEQLRPSEGEARLDWTAIEQQVLTELRTSKGQEWADVNTLADLILRVVSHEAGRLPDQLTVDKLARDLAEACESLLRNFASRLSALELFNRDVAKQADRLDTLRTRSAPFLRQSKAANLPPDANTKLSQYLGIASSTSPAATAFANQLQQSGSALQSMAGLEKFDMENDALVLYQEKSGIPLFYYSLLDHLGNLYLRSNRQRDTHFDFPALKGRLPDIRKVDLQKQRNLANSLESTLYGIMTGVLAFDRGQFRLWRAGLAFPLGGQFEDVFNHAADDGTVRAELQNQVEVWMKKALASGQGSRLALLWCAVQYLHEEVRQRLQWQIDREGQAGKLGIQDHPLLSILAGRMIPRLKQRLEHLPDGNGPRWLASGLDILSILASPHLEPGERAQALQHWRQSLRDYMEPISEAVPIPVIRPGAQLDLMALERTGGPPQAASSRQPDNGAPAPQGSGREKK
jgi:hypothetical protein